MINCYSLILCSGNYRIRLINSRYKQSLIIRVLCFYFKKQEKAIVHPLDFGRESRNVSNFSPKIKTNPKWAEKTRAIFHESRQKSQGHLVEKIKTYRNLVEITFTSTFLN